MSALDVSVDERHPEKLLLSLPLPELVEILSKCDVQSLGRLSRTCRKLRQIIKSEGRIWKHHSVKQLVTNQLNELFQKKSFSVLSPKEKCRIAKQWLSSDPTEHFILKMKKISRRRIIPWIELERSRLYFTEDSEVKFVRRLKPGHFELNFQNSNAGHSGDIVKFVCTEEYIISGGRDQRVCVWDKNTHNLSFRTPVQHQSDINSVACWNDVVVSGSRDCTVKVWSSLPYLSCRYGINVLDKVWHVATLYDGRFFLVGTGSSNNAHPLRLFDLETGVMLMRMGFEKFRAGDGVYHIFPESHNEFYTGTYDSAVHLWDIRCPNKWVKKWDESNDSGIYCIDSDHSFTFIGGTSRHGIVRLWDKRSSKEVRVFYMGKGRETPVYSVAFDAQILCAALDTCICFRDFSK